MVLRALSFSLGLFSCFCFSQDAKDLKNAPTKKEGSVTTINLIQFKKEIKNNPDITIIDVRTKKEYNLGFIHRAINSSIRNRKKFKTAVNKLDKFKPVYVYCYSGIRSKRASKRLKKYGFKKIYDFKGGWKRWSE